MNLFQKFGKTYFCIDWDDKVAKFYYEISSNCNYFWYKVYDYMYQNLAFFYLYHYDNNYKLYVHVDLIKLHFYLFSCMALS